MEHMEKTYDVIVVGAGIVGINTAYWNLRNGKSVCVIDRRAAAGLETSFANGGQISVSHAEPWSNPSAPLKVLKWLFDGEAPLLFRPRFDIRQWLWIAQFLVDCMPWRADRHTTEIVKIATQSRALYREMREREKIEYDSRSEGILHFYRDAREFEGAARVAELMCKHGCNRHVIGADKVVELEPAFEDRRQEIVGATFTEDDESGDAFKFTQGLAARCAQMGADFLYNAEAVSLLKSGANAVDAIEVMTPQGYKTVRGRDIVVSLGSFSADFVRPLGVRLNIYPAKGYSVTIPIGRSNRAPTRSLTDDQYKLVYSNLGDRLRVAGTAELSGYGRQLSHPRCEAILRNVRGLFPDAGDFSAAQFWSGLRPATPSNLPYVGRTRVRNLWLNTGHGTLGWTMGAATGNRIAEMIASGDGPVVA
ncbi:MAG TPA: D-amino acid dehydrogenase [Xanthobacteraceae bacterium]|nr:D-amino acid dehydrogenase [Xanthobacteraceae bacterium]